MTTILQHFRQYAGRYLLLTLCLHIGLHLRILPLELRGIHLWRQAETMTVVHNYANGHASLLSPKVANEAFYRDGIKRMEFPILSWVYAGVYRVFGHHISLIRILTLLISIGTLWAAFRLGNALIRDSAGGLLTAWLAAWSPLFFYYSVNPMPDNLALMATMAFLASWFRWQNAGNRQSLYSSAVWLGLAVATKLPFAVWGAIPLIAGLQLMGSKSRVTNKFGSIIRLWLPFALGIIIPAIWYLSVIPTWEKNGVIVGILEAESSQTTVLLGYLWGIFSSILPELLINYGAVLFFITGLVLIFRNRIWKTQHYIPFAGVGILLLAYLLFELNLITTAHDYYLMPFLPVLFLLGARGAKAWLRHSKAIAIGAIILLVALPVLATLRAYPRWTHPRNLGYHPDYLAHQAELVAAVPPNAKCLVATDGTPYALLYLMRKQGANIEPKGIRPWIWELAKREQFSVLYSDSRSFEQQAFVQPVLGDTILKRGEIIVFSLNW